MLTEVALSSAATLVIESGFFKLHNLYPQVLRSLVMQLLVTGWALSWAFKVVTLADHTFNTSLAERYCTISSNADNWDSNARLCCSESELHQSCGTQIGHVGSALPAVRQLVDRGVVCPRLSQSCARSRP